MKLWHWIAIIALTMATVVGQFIEHYYWWEAIPGFFAAFAFIGCMILMFGAKLLGKILVTKSPDYYEKLNPPKEEKTDAY